MVRIFRAVAYGLVATWTGCALGTMTPKCSSGKECPHIIMVLVDDMGWNNVPWHNRDLESVMPNSLKLVREGIELDRHYAYAYCSPSRSSLLSGRLPHHVNQINTGPNYASSGIHRLMTTIPKKLKEAGYRTHTTGKWHCGSATFDQTPKGRGFDTHFGYFDGAEDHWTQLNCIDLLCAVPDPAPYPLNKTMGGDRYDLWLTDTPAFNMIGEYGDQMFSRFAVDMIQAHPVASPMFFYIAFQNDHSPLQAPQKYVDMFPREWRHDRRVYAALGVYWDEALGNITQALKDKGMWDNTLLILSSDNGGPVYPSATPGYPYCGGANNYPLLGGKSTFFEGGVRVAAFASGGIIPKAVRGTKLDGNVHITDWYATFCGLAGVSSTDPEAVAAGLPDTDAVDVWPLLIGSNTTSPRWEIPLGISGTTLEAHQAFAAGGIDRVGVNSALIAGDYKLIVGPVYSGFHQAQDWPVDPDSCCTPDCWNETYVNCGTLGNPTCLYNIRSDPNETINLYMNQTEIVARMRRRIEELSSTLFCPQCSDQPNSTAYAVMQQRYSIPAGKGYFNGPWVDVAHRLEEVVV